ncbi:hypothetical protein ACFV7R_11780 [Streptomyces sp. NPDC059866]|uniref:hypothetical protein n=1 Tax=Streptomyces sp. NPDC059866 TaxID=3346978 RepID=UPI00365D70DB
MSLIDWGDAPTWAGAVFAATAAAAAIWTLKSQRDQIDEQRRFIEEQSANLQLERAELIAVAQERKEAQARRVRMELTRPYLSVVNGSEGPIRDVVCHFGDEVRRTAYVSRDQSPEAQLQALLRGELDGGDPPVEVLGSGQGAAFARPDTVVGLIAVSFVDEAGVRWNLDELGALTQNTGDA